MSYQHNQSRLEKGKFTLWTELTIFTFGIITAGNSDDSLNAVIDSIEQQNISEYQILIVGNSNVSRTNTFIIPFNESIKHAWITRKKNLITINSRYQNVVYSHDYDVTLFF